ncbi:MAG: hypothetical protein ACKOCW_04265 [Planctomycetaceae bacterium]
MEHPRDLTAWLEQARKRPGMFVVGKSLAQLEAQCVGWSAALAAHGIDDCAVGFNRRFCRWLRATQGWSVSRGWADAILRASDGDPETAWTRFFELFDTFRTAEPPVG